jgi:hypothetical protein
MIVLIGLFCLVLGLLAGFWAKDIYITIHAIKDQHSEAKAFSEAGVVRPQSYTINRPIDLSKFNGSSTGGVRRPTPEQAKLKAMEERDERLKAI